MGDKEEEEAKKQADQEFRDRTNPTGFSTESLIPPTKVTPAITAENRKTQAAKPVTAEQYAINQALREAVPDWVKQNTALKGGAKRGMAKKVREFVRKQGHLPTTSQMHLPSPTPVEGESPLVGQNAGVELRHPWTIFFKSISGSIKFGVEFHSDVYDGMSWDKITVSGLTEDPSNDSDPGWHSPDEGFVFLWGTVDEDGVVTDIDVLNDQASLDDIVRVTSVDGIQTKFAWVLGYIWNAGTELAPQWLVRQEAFRHVTLMYVVVNGVLCKVPFEM